MKITKIALPFYNSVLVFTIITTWFLTQSYGDLAPILLLVPVWIYFVVTTIDKIISFSHFSENKNIKKLIKMMAGLRIYSFAIVLLIIIANLAYSSGFFESTITIVFLPLIAYFFSDFFNKDNYSQFTIKNIILLAKRVKSTSERNKKTKKAVDLEEKLVEAEIVEQDERLINSKDEGLEVDDAQVIEKEESVDEQILENDEEISEEKAAEIEKLTLEQEDEDFGEIKDLRRRQFLKIVGGGGVSMFLMLFVFQQKASAAFFGSGGGPGVVAIKDSSGTKIDPAEKQPTDGYNIAELDDSTLPSYYGFTHKEGNWYIAQESSGGSYRYAKGSSNFATNWTNRTGLSYDYFDNVF